MGCFVSEVLTPLSGLGPGDGRMWQCLNRLQLSSEGCEWLQETWGVPSGAWRPLVLKAQNALYKVIKHLQSSLWAEAIFFFYSAVFHVHLLSSLFQVVDMCAAMFCRLASRYPRGSSESAQLTAVLCRVKDRVTKVCNSVSLGKTHHLLSNWTGNPSDFSTSIIFSVPQLVWMMVAVVIILSLMLRPNVLALCIVQKL